MGFFLLEKFNFIFTTNPLNMLLHAGPTFHSLLNNFLLCFFLLLSLSIDIYFKSSFILRILNFKENFKCTQLRVEGVQTLKYFLFSTFFIKILTHPSRFETQAFKNLLKILLKSNQHIKLCVLIKKEYSKICNIMTMSFLEPGLFFSHPSNISIIFTKNNDLA